VSSSMATVLTLPGARIQETTCRLCPFPSTPTTFPCQKIRPKFVMFIHCTLQTITFNPKLDVVSDHSRSSSPSSNDDPWGCAYIQAVRQQVDNFATTGGEYLETIFTHREILSAYPEAHRHCARGLSDIAYIMERRAWRADRDADPEAIVAFRHEAWAIAASM
jgi:hypothetical protein